MDIVTTSIEPSTISPGLLGLVIFLAIVITPIVVLVVVIVRAMRGRGSKGHWYPDPDGSGLYRWHNGYKWTDFYTDDPSAPPRY